MPLLNMLRLCLRVVGDAYNQFNAADGWAIASHIALSILLALFPFLATRRPDAYGGLTHDQ